MTNIINVLCYLAGTCWLVFVIAYHLRARWWESPTGRNVMGTAVGIAMILAVTVVARIAPDWSGRPVLQTVTFAALAAFGVQRTTQMLIAQREPRPPRRSTHEP